MDKRFNDNFVLVHAKGERGRAAGIQKMCVIYGQGTKGKEVRNALQGADVYGKISPNKVVLNGKRGKFSAKEKYTCECRIWTIPQKNRREDDIFCGVSTMAAICGSCAGRLKKRVLFTSL